MEMDAYKLERLEILARKQRVATIVTGLLSADQRYIQTHPDAAEILIAETVRAARLYDAEISRRDHEKI